MQKQIIFTPKVAKSASPLSQAVAFGSLLFVSGQVAGDPTGGRVEGGFEAQARQVMENIKAILEEAGSSLDCVLKVTAFLSNMDDFPKFNEIYRTYFPKDFPARSCFQVGRLGPGFLVEIEAMAYIPDTDE
jgi:2-iminobutanoate/2-iminopropanoate deaminase